MSIFIFTLSFLVFIYCIYKFVKDDYIFIRRNISSEQMLDIVFNVTWISLFFSRLLFFIGHPVSGNAFLSFFTLNANEYSLTGLVIGGIIGLYLIGRSKKLPIMRLLSFFGAAFSVSLPIAFLSILPLFKEYVLLLFFLNAIIYSFFAYYFIRYFQTKPIFFFLFFFSVTLTNSIILIFLEKSNFINVENVLLALAIITSLIFYFKQK